MGETTRKFKIGERVRIRRDSQYANQSDEVGVVESVDTSYDSHPYFVRLAHGETLCYNANDLDSAEAEKASKPSKLKKIPSRIDYRAPEVESSKPAPTYRYYGMDYGSCTA